eukprot:PhM_4_TR16092/c0_g2_i1/m.90119
MFNKIRKLLRPDTSDKEHAFALLDVVASKKPIHDHSPEFIFNVPPQGKYYNSSLPPTDDLQVIGTHVSVSHDTMLVGTTDPLPLGFYVEVRLDSSQLPSVPVGLNVVSVKSDGSSFDNNDADLVQHTFQSTGSTPPIPRLAASDTFGFGVTSHGKAFLTLNGVYLGSPTSPPMVFNPSTSKCVLRLAAPVGGVALSYTFGAPGHEPFLFDPSMPRVPTMVSDGSQQSEQEQRPAGPKKFICGTFVSVSAHPDGTTTLENTDPDTSCRHLRESQAQVLPPIGSANPHPYVEMTVTSVVGKEAVVGLGVAPQYISRGSFEGLPGWARQTIGVHSDDGNAYIGTGTGQPFLSRGLTIGDVLGCGIDAMYNIFYTLNGTYVGKVAPIPASVGIDAACFTVGLDPQTSVRVATAPPFTYVVDRTSAVRAEVTPAIGLSRDAMLHVCSFLTPGELLRVSGACAAWYDAVSDDTNWLPRMSASSRAQLKECTSNVKFWYFHDARRHHREQLAILEVEKMLEELERTMQDSVCECRKPVIYVYGPPGQPTCVDVTVRLTDPDSTMLFVHPTPTHDNSVDSATWQSHVPRSAGGTVPYLFWEAALPTPSRESSPLHRRSVVVATVALDKFGRAVPPLLRARGMSSVEISDFVSYWVPSLRAAAAEQPSSSSSPKRFVEIGFLPRDIIEDGIATLNVSHSDNGHCVGAKGAIHIHRVYATFRLSEGGCTGDEDVFFLGTDTTAASKKRGNDDDDAGPVRADVLSRGDTYVLEWGGIIL